MTSVVRWFSRLAGVAAVAAACPMATAQGQPVSTVVYKCPGNVYTSDRELTAKQAADQGCKVIEGQPITIIQGRPPAPPRSASPGGNSADSTATPRPPDARVDPAAQRSRDGEARRILERELRREEERLADLRREYKNGEPERLGSERNYQKYLDRVAGMKAGIDRKEADVAAIKRELAKLPPP